MDDALGRLLLESSRLWRNLLNRTLAEHDLTVAGWSVLHSLLRDGEGITQKELAARLSVEGPTLVKLLDNLACKGWVCRRISPADRRANTVWLTPEARARVGTIETELTDMYDNISDSFPNEQLQSFQQMLEQLKTRLETQHQQAV